MSTPQDDEFMRRNATLMAQELEEEGKYASLKRHGIPCDGCEELFSYEELESVELDEVGTAHLCKDC